MFKKENILLVESVENWEEAVRKSANLLLYSGDIEKRYIEAMIGNIEKYGFYIVIDYLVAMPHSRAEDGVINNSISLLKINNAVKFGENDVNLVFSLAAKDSSSHIDIIKNLLDILQDDDKKNALISETNLEGIYKILGVEV